MPEPTITPHDLAVVRQFVERVEQQSVYGGLDCCEHCSVNRALYAELAALEARVGAEEEERDD